MNMWEIFKKKIDHTGLGDLGFGVALFLLVTTVILTLFIKVTQIPSYYVCEGSEEERIEFMQECVGEMQACVDRRNEIYNCAKVYGTRE